MSAIANIADLERYAQTHLPKNAWDYYSSGMFVCFLRR